VLVSEADAPALSGDPMAEARSALAELARIATGAAYAPGELAELLSARLASDRAEAAREAAAEAARREAWLASPLGRITEARRLAIERGADPAELAGSPFGLALFASLADR
jgi:hypothetical protein